MNVSLASPRSLIVIIDDQTLKINSPLTFKFRDNPSFTSVSPQRSILSKITIGIILVYSIAYLCNILGILLLKSVLVRA